MTEKKIGGKKMKTISIKPIADWMHRNARELELAVWKYHFEGGSKEAIISALMYYQNEDGGFGFAVEPDNWNTASTPYATLHAMKLLASIDFWDMTHPIHQGIRAYVEATFMEGWHFVIPSNNECPCASYFRYDKAYDEVERIGVILDYCRFVLTYYSDSKMYDEVLKVLPTYIEKIEEEQLGDMGPLAYVELIDAMEKENIPGYDYDRLQEKLDEIIDKTIQRDPKLWDSYGYRPSAFIHSKQDRRYLSNKETIMLELDFLCDTLPNYDVWANPWSWFDNNDKYPAAYQLSTNWYKAEKAIERTLFLKAFDRVRA